MEILGGLVMILGVIVSFVYGIILIVKAFQASIVWGLIYIVVPFGAIIFIITHWDEAGKPFLMSLLSIPLLFGGMMIAQMG